MFKVRWKRAVEAGCVALYLGQVIGTEMMFITHITQRRIANHGLFWESKMGVIFGWRHAVRDIDGVTGVSRKVLAEFWPFVVEFEFSRVSRTGAAPSLTLQAAWTCLVTLRNGKSALLDV